MRGWETKVAEKLTKRVVDAAHLPQGNPKKWTWLGDIEVPGFGVKLYGNGRRVYCLRYRTRSGRQRMLQLGLHGELTVQQARDMARKEKVAVLEGDDPQAERQRQAVGLLTVKEMMDKWINEYAKAHRRGWTEDQRRVNRRIVPKLGKLRLEDLTPDVLATWHRRMGQNSPVEANRCLETLRAAWRWAEREGLLAPGLTNPAMRVKRYRERSRDRWLRTEEVARLMESVAKEKDPYVTAAIPLLLLTGLRKRELLGAKWEDVDLARGEIRLPMTKTGEAQVRVLIAPAVELLRELPRMAESGFVFPRPTDPSKPRDDIKKPWDRIRKRAGLTEVTLHDLRRTAGSVMAQEGVPLEIIGKVLGHAHPSVTRLYARLSSENEREALNSVADVLGGAMGLSEAQRRPGGLREKLRGLLEAAENDPEALAAGLKDLADQREVSGGVGHVPDRVLPRVVTTHD